MSIFHPTKVVIFYRNSKTIPGKPGPYHAGGLASNALHSVGVLREMGVDADLQAVTGFSEVIDRVQKDRVTHAIVEAVWVMPAEVIRFAHNFPHVKIVVRAHSKIGFLQVEPEAIPVMRDLIDIHDRHGYQNVIFSSNNAEFTSSLEEVYGNCLYLPNLYDLSSAHPRHQTCDGKLRIASFGATRLLKLHPAAALAALQVACRYDSDLEFYVNTDKTPGGESVRNTMRNLFKDLDWARLIEISWQDAQTFKETIANMDVVLQMSATETFCLVASDAVASGVPVVVGPAIEWIPTEFQVRIDDTSLIADKVCDVFGERNRVVKLEQEALRNFIKHAKKVWSDFLELKKPPKRWWW